MTMAKGFSHKQEVFELKIFSCQNLPECEFPQTPINLRPTNIFGKFDFSSLFSVIISLMENF